MGKMDGNHNSKHTSTTWRRGFCFRQLQPQSPRQVRLTYGLVFWLVVDAVAFENRITAIVQQKMDMCKTLRRFDKSHLKMIQYAPCNSLENP